MGNNDEKDRKLLKNIDHILAGQEGEIDKNLDEETRVSLEFARRLASLREKPTKDFAENLKAELAHRLAEQERQESSRNQHFLFWEMPRRTLWQGTIAAAILLIILLIIFLVIVLTEGS